MIVKIKCAKCDTEGSLSLSDPSYQGPYRCWKCRQLFTIKMENNELKSCEPLGQEEFEKQQEIEALKAKFKRGQLLESTAFPGKVLLQEYMSSGEESQ